MKQTFLISAILLGILLLVLGIYNVAFRHNPNNATVENTQTSMTVSSDTVATNTPPPAKPQLIEVLSDEKAFSPRIDSNENTILYFASNSHALKQVSLDTRSIVTIMELSGEPLRAVWSPVDAKALVELRTLGGVRWFLVDSVAKTELPLPGGIGNPVWTNVGDRIVYRYDDDAKKEHTLNISKSDGSDWKKIAENSFRALGSMIEPQGSLLAFWNQGNAFEETSLKTVSIVGGEVKQIFSGKYGADYKYSPDGKMILMSSTDRKGGNMMTLGLLINQGTQYRNLGIPTLVSKTVWSKDSHFVYFALPGALPENAILPNDYFMKPLFSQDTFWKVDVTTGEKQRIIDIKDVAAGYDATALAIHNDGTALVFVNRRDGKLYRIQL